MPFKYDPEISDEKDQKIMSILYFGRKRQKEVVAMSDLSQSTVRNHLDDLVDYHKVTKEEKTVEGEEGERVTEVYYELEDGRSEVVPPYPLADNEKIYELLFSIKNNIEKIKNFYVNEDDIPPWDKRNKGEIGGFQTENVDIVHSNDELLQNSSELSKLSGKRYHMLSHSDNFELFFEMIDAVIDSYLIIADEELYLRHPSRALDDIIMAANEILVNYENSEENEMYMKEMSKRVSSLVDLVDQLPSHLGDSIMVLAFAIDQEKGQEAFKNAILSDKYDKEELVLKAFEYYIRRNHTNILWEDLEDLEDVNNGEYEEIAKDIKQTIKKRYYQVTNSDESIDDKL